MVPLALAACHSRCAALPRLRANPPFDKKCEQSRVAEGRRAHLDVSHHGDVGTRVLGDDVRTGLNEFPGAALRARGVRGRVLSRCASISVLVPGCTPRQSDGSLLLRRAARVHVREAIGATCCTSRASLACTAISECSCLRASAQPQSASEPTFSSITSPPMLHGWTKRKSASSSPHSKLNMWKRTLIPYKAWAPPLANRTVPISGWCDPDGRVRRRVPPADIHRSILSFSNGRPTLGPTERTSDVSSEAVSHGSAGRTAELGRECAFTTGCFQAAKDQWPLSGDDFGEPTAASRP